MKKNFVKWLMLAGAAILLVAATIMGTLAYLTSSSAVTNTFTIGNVGIQMFETKVNSAGVPVSPVEKVDTNSYHLQPGAKYVKDPTVYVNANSDISYLFVKVRNDIRGIEAKSEAGVYTSMVDQVSNNGWIYLGSTFNANVYVYETFVGGVATEEDYPIFTEFKIAENADLSLSGGAKVILTAFAIQKTGFEPATGTGDDAQAYLTAAHAAWDVLAETYTTENGDIISTTPIK